jgi:hypothetical protein
MDTKFKNLTQDAKKKMNKKINISSAQYAKY